MCNKCNTSKKKQKQLATCQTTSLSSPETIFSLLIMISASRISPLIHYSIQMRESAYAPSKGSAIYMAFARAEHCKEIVKLFLGSRVQAVSKSTNVEKDYCFFFIAHSTGRCLSSLSWPAWSWQQQQSFCILYH